MKISPEDLLRVAAEFLPQRQGRGILRVSPADLYDLAPGLGLHVERGVQAREPRQQLVVHLRPDGACEGLFGGVEGCLEAHFGCVTLLLNPNSAFSS